MPPAKAPRVLDPDELRRARIMASPHMLANLLLCINCGLRNPEWHLIPRSAYDLEGGWLTFPRTKAGVRRRCPLWLETTAAIKAARAAAPGSKTAKDVKLLRAVRRTFEALIGGLKDQVAVDAILGLASERVDDYRLVAVTDLIRTWIF